MDFPMKMRLSSGFSPDSGKRPGIPPSHPNNHHSSLPFSQFVGCRSDSQNLGSRSSHSRSLSQPTIFSLEGLTSLNCNPRPDHNHNPSVPSLSDPISEDVSLEAEAVNALPPRRGHRRSRSDVPLGFSAMIQSSPQLIPVGSRNSGLGKPIQLMKEEPVRSRNGNGNVDEMDEGKREGEVAEDLINEYMNLENVDALNSSGAEDKDSRASGMKKYGGESSDNEVESQVNGKQVGSSTETREGVKRRAPTGRHCRSVSMDSYMENLNFDDESLKLPRVGNNQHSPGNSMDGSGSTSKFNLELGNGGFSGEELKKILANDKLTEIAISDPKRAKRILSNRLSAARSKERKMLYMSQLENKVQTLQAEATTLSAQVTVLQREFSGLTSENNELKLRLQAMEQQAQLKDALNETLAAEVRHLKLLAAELNGDAHLSSCLAQQLSINHQILQRQQQFPQQRTEPPKHNQMQSQQWNGKVANHDSMNQGHNRPPN